MNKNRNSIKPLLAFPLFITAMGLIVYPFIANYISENRADSIVHTVRKLADSLDNKKKQAAIEQAQNYNDIISCGHIELKDPFIYEQLDDVGDYDSLLCMTDDGVMGFIEIPSIDLSLPIYHGTSEQILEMGAGHLQGTSLPIGGKSTHTVLTGHSGLSKAKLFSDLIELKEGDIFFLNVMGERLTYKVDQITVVLPDELNDLYVEAEKDYCTLVTCTPYGVNTHRLLVRGIRSDYLDETDNPEVFRKKKIKSKWMADYKRALLISAVCFSVSLMILSCLRFYKKIYDYYGKEN